MWVEGRIVGRKVSLGESYLWTGKESKEQNVKLVACLKKDMECLKQSGKVVLVGDMNAHIKDLDGYKDCNWKLVLDLCEDQNQILVNREQKCEGKRGIVVGDSRVSTTASTQSDFMNGWVEWA